MPAVHCPREVGFAALNELGSVPWGELHHAYGKGVTGEELHDDVAASLKLLEEDVDEAINGALYANICHQGTVYEATAWAVPFLAAVAAGDIDDEPRIQLVTLLAHIAAASATTTEDGSHAGSFGTDVAETIREALQRASGHLQSAAERDDALSAVVEAIAAVARTPNDDHWEQLEDAISDLSYEEDDDGPTPEELAAIRERRARGLRTLARLEVGSVVLGRVTALTAYGAFIDLGGIDGLLHRLDLGAEPADKFEIGDEVRVVVMKLDREKESITLGLAG